jgi:hypothetical protein
MDLREGFFDSEEKRTGGSPWAPVLKAFCLVEEERRRRGIAINFHICGFFFGGQAGSRAVILLSREEHGKSPCIYVGKKFDSKEKRTGGSLLSKSLQFL